MSTGTKRLVRRFGTLADGTVSIIDLVASIVFGQCLASDTLFVHPSVRVPDGGVLPDQGVHLGDTRGSEDEMSLGNDVRGVLFRDGRRGDRSGNGNVGHDLSHDRVNGRVLQVGHVVVVSVRPSKTCLVIAKAYHPESFPDTRIE